MEYPSEHYKLIEELKTRNFIKSTSIARVMKEVDRADFVNMLPYTDWFPFSSFSKFKFKSPSPIGYSANISAPHMDAICLGLLKDHLTTKGKRALDIGSGSGYFTTHMGKLMSDGFVYGIDHI